MDEHQIDPPIVATASSSEMVRSLVGSGVGCSLLNMRPLISETYGGDKVVPVPIRAPGRALELSLGYVGESSRRIVDTFIKACLDYFDQPEAQKLVASQS